MKNVSAISLALLFLLAVGIEGIITSGRGRCRCQNMYSKRIPLSLVSNIVDLSTDPACNKPIYLVIMKEQGKQDCLDQTSPAVQKMYKRWKTQPRWRMPTRPQ